MLVPLFLSICLLTCTCVSANSSASSTTNSVEKVQDNRQPVQQAGAGDTTNYVAILISEGLRVAAEKRAFSRLSDPEVTRMFSELVKERRKLQRRMFYHMTASLLVRTLTYLTRSNPVFVHTMMFIHDQNDNWGMIIEVDWIYHQEKMADFLLNVLERKNIDPKTLKGKKIRLEIAHHKYAVVPIFRTYPHEPLPVEARRVNNKVNFWRNYFTR